MIGPAPALTPRDRLIAALASGDILLVAGVGVSRALAGDASPTWRALVESGIGDIVAKQLHVDPSWQDITERLIATGATEDLVEAASRVERMMGKAEFGDWLKRLFGGWPVQREHPVAHALTRLRAPILTTNYDTVLERTLGMETVTWRTPQLVQEVLRGDKSSVAHLHGVWSVPTSVVFGTESYQRLVDSEAAQAVQQAMVVGKRLLLIGCGATAGDPNLGRLFEWLSTTLRDAPRAHFALMRSGDEIELPEGFYPLAYGERHDELVPYLERLADDTFSSISGAAVPSSPAAIPLSTASSANTPRHNLPVRTYRQLVGRDLDLTRLIDAAMEPGCRVVVEGAVGTGKTALALEACHRLVAERPGDPDVVVWVTMHDIAPGPASPDVPELRDALTTIAMVIDRPEILHLDPDIWVAATHAALARERPLLVFDNFEAVRSQELISFVERLSSSCRTIITSRRKLAFGVPQHLEALGDEDARQLAESELSRGGINVDPQFVRDVAQRSGGNPLAISLLVGQALAGPPHTQRDARTLDSEDVIAALLDETLRTLAGQLERAGLLITALLPGGVPASVLETALARFTAPEGEPGKAIAGLVRLNLLDYDGARRRYTTLPVFRRYLSRGSSRPEAGWAEDVKAARLAIIHAYGDHLAARARALWESAPPTHPQWELERPAIFATIRIAIEERGFDAAGRLLQDFYTFAITFGHFGEFLEWTDAVLTSGQTIDPLLNGALRVRRASILVHAERNEEARGELKGALAVLEGIALPPDLQNFVYFVRAVVAVANHDEDAEHILREAIAFEQERDVAWARLGFQGWLVLYLVSAGRLLEAEELCAQSLDEARQRGDRRTEVFLLVGQTRLNRGRGDWMATLDTAADALALAEDAGEDHNRAHLYTEVARACLATGDTYRARLLLEKAELLYARIGVMPEATRCRELLDVEVFDQHP